MENVFLFSYKVKFGTYRYNVLLKANQCDDHRTLVNRFIKHAVRFFQSESLCYHIVLTNWRRITWDVRVELSIASILYCFHMLKQCVDGFSRDVAFILRLLVVVHNKRYELRIMFTIFTVDVSFNRLILRRFAFQSVKLSQRAWLCFYNVSKHMCRKNIFFLGLVMSILSKLEEQHDSESLLQSLKIIFGIKPLLVKLNFRQIVNAFFFIKHSNFSTASDNLIRTIINIMGKLREVNFLHDLLSIYACILFGFDLSRWFWLWQFDLQVAGRNTACIKALIGPSEAVF